ncbi:MAG: MarR family transcriptional regulator [Azospirillaceae bacterium]|nr:MarR family transcriptional regulator [Azospirillaceae bacterium]
MNTEPVTLPPIYDETSYRPVRNVGRHMIDVAAQLNHAIDRRASVLGITGPQWIVLIRIGSGVGASAAELCRLLGHDSGSMTRMLDRLEKRNLIRRDRCVEDRRIVKLKLTESGWALYPKLAPVAVDVQNRLLRGFTHDEVAQLMGFLDRMLANEVDR